MGLRAVRDRPGSPGSGPGPGGWAAGCARTSRAAGCCRPCRFLDLMDASGGAAWRRLAADAAGHRRVRLQRLLLSQAVARVRPAPGARGVPAGARQRAGLPAPLACQPAARWCCPGPAGSSGATVPMSRSGTAGVPALRLSPAASASTSTAITAACCAPAMSCGSTGRSCCARITGWNRPDPPVTAARQRRTQLPRRATRAPRSPPRTDLPVRWCHASQAESEPR